MNDFRLKNESPEDTTALARSLNQKLADISRMLTGTRSTMHYVAESAYAPTNNIFFFEQYVAAQLSEWNQPHASVLEEALRQLDTFRESLRDNDTLVMIRRQKLQQKADIEILQQSTDINFGIVSYFTSWLAITNNH